MTDPAAWFAEKRAEDLTEPSQDDWVLLVRLWRKLDEMEQERKQCP